MKRTRAEALVLVNWRGVFYERYLLDPRVTALEGVNAAGKTTVMIAAYVVLLPDMTRLRFTNLGEAGAVGGDKGIYGRLGQPGPSYAALDIRLPQGARVVAGVHLLRKAEPVVELTPFILTDLADGVSLQEVLLDRGQEEDGVPELERVRELATRCGAHLKIPASAKDYFAELFDLGVFPLRLATDEERTKLNEMLRTSMVGGISRALTGGMREFLLKEETGLGDTLRRMRGNLDACRRTRQQVSEARQLENEIHGVFEAGQRMFAAAVQATRERERELKVRVDEARATLAQATGERDRRAAELADLQVRRTAAQGQLEAARGALSAATHRLEAVRQARSLADQLRDAEVERRRRLEVERATHAARDAAEAAVDQARTRQATAQDRMTAAARGLADSQHGLDLLNRRAAEHREAVAALAAARASFPERRLEPDGVSDALAACELRATNLAAAINEAEADLSVAEARRHEHERLIGALERIAGRAVPWSDAHGAARTELMRLRELDALVEELPDLPRRVETARRAAALQRDARAEATGVQRPGEQLATSADVRTAFDVAEAEHETCARDLNAAIDDVRRAEHALQEAQSAVVRLERRAQRWRDAQAGAAALARRWQCSVRTRAELEVLRGAVQVRLNDAAQALRAAGEERRTLYDEIGRLEQLGGSFPEDLVHAVHAVDGELLAGRFEEIDVDEAGRVQARLGPLCDAIVVEDPRAAAASLVKVERRPDTVWLVGGDAALHGEGDLPEGESLGDCVLVTGSAGWRLTRVAQHPSVGRRARQRRIAALAARERALDGRIQELAAEERELDDGLKEIAARTAEVALLEQPDPAPELERERGRETAAAREHGLHLATVRRHEARLSAVKERSRALSHLLPAAHLLDEQDWAAAGESLRGRLARARQAAAAIELLAAARALLETGLDALRRPPLTPEQATSLVAQRDSLRVQLQALPRRELAYLDQHREALTWTDAEAALSRERELRPALEEQLNSAERDLEQRHAELSAADGARTSAVDAHLRADAALRTVVERIEGLQQAFADTGVDDVADEALTDAERLAAEHAATVADLDHGERELAEEVARREPQLAAAEKSVESGRLALIEVEQHWKPALENWERLRGAAEAQGLLAAAVATTLVGVPVSSVNLWPQAKTEAQLALDRIARTPDGEVIAADVRAGLESAEQASGDAYLTAWLRMREWLQRRVPPQIAETPDPLEALARLRHHLEHLEERLGQQEVELRGQSEDVARNIETQVRKAKRQVQRLTHDLERARFGSIAGIRLQVRRVERMYRVLEALREGTAQQLLFHADIPIEEAMDELFRQFGGGKTGGHKLLDYREYIDLQVEVRRQASFDWEVVQPTHLSTGEAIGVGAAIMMVVLTAWERDANLLRGKRAHGTLRLLFLDEATRLSPDNLAVLFDLCEGLELQLLLAAPEVAHAEGNTTYRLVRRLDESGKEEVLVTGRRLLKAGDT